jgi:antitoxin CptB
MTEHEHTLSPEQSAPELELKRLRWQCRRGMREMDMLLERWLDARYLKIDAARQAAFQTLLKTEDDLLWDWMMAKADPTDSLQAELIVEIRDAYSLK